MAATRRLYTADAEEAAGVRRAFARGAHDYGEYTGIKAGTATTGRAVCLECGERIAVGAPVIVSERFCGGFNQFSKRSMHVECPAVAIVGA